MCLVSSLKNIFSELFVFHAFHNAHSGFQNNESFRTKKTKKTTKLQQQQQQQQHINDDNEVKPLLFHICSVHTPFRWMEVCLLINLSIPVHGSLAEIYFFIFVHLE